MSPFLKISGTMKRSNYRRAKFESCYHRGVLKSVLKGLENKQIQDSILKKAPYMGNRSKQPNTGIKLIKYRSNFTSNFHNTNRPLMYVENVSKPWQEYQHHPSLVQVKAKRTIVRAVKMVTQGKIHITFPLPFSLSPFVNSASFKSSLTSSISESFAACISLP